MIFELLMFVFMHIMLREPTQAARSDLGDGTRVVRYGWALRFLPLVIFACLSYVGLVILQIGLRNRGDAVFLGLLGLLAFVNGLIAVSTNCFRLTLGEGVIIANSAWRLRRELSWGEITEVTYSSSANAFVLKGERGEKVLVPRMTNGIGTFVAECRRRLRFMTYLHASTEFEKIERLL